MTKPLIDQAVDRFLGWKLPQDFNPDCGISFTIPINATWFPTGTNLLHAGQAKAMLEHVAEPLLARISELEAQNKHDDEADTACRNLLCEERDAAEARRDLYRETIREFLSTVLTIKRENQPEWMEYLAERINEVCEVIGEEDRVAYNPRQEAILPIKK